MTETITLLTYLLSLLWMMSKSCHPLSL